MSCTSWRDCVNVIFSKALLTAISAGIKRTLSLNSQFLKPKLNFFCEKLKLCAIQ